MERTDIQRKKEYPASGLFDCLYDEKFTLYNSQNNLYEFLGYTLDEMDRLFHNYLIECIYPDDRLKIKEEIKKQLAVSNVFVLENRLLTKTGEIRFIWISGELRQDEIQGDYFHCIFHDISDAKKSQEALAISEQRYEIVLSQMQDIIFELDCKTLDIYYSPNFEKKFGYTIPSKGFPDSMFKTDIIFEADKAPLREKFQSLLKGEKQMQHEYRIRRRDGVYLWVDVHATTLCDSEGNLMKILGIISDINERKTEILETQKIAKLDPLTGLLNRRECIRRIEKYMEESSRTAAFLLIDIDNFKQLNDTMGHLYGDAVLKEIAGRLKSIFRRTDVVSRIGGDEFVIFLPEIGEKENVFPKLKEIQNLFFCMDTSADVPQISSSVGVCFYPEHGTDFTSLFAKADDSMYYTKKHGKNSYCLYAGHKPSVVEKSQPVRTILSIQKNFHSEIVEGMFDIFLKNTKSQPAMPKLLQFLGTRFRSDRVYICQKTKDGQFRKVYSWCSQGIGLEEDTLKEVITLDWKLPSELPVAAYRDIKKIREQSIRTWFERRKVKSAFLCLLGEEKELLNIIGFEDCHGIRPEGEEMRYALFMVSEMLNLFLVKDYSSDMIHSQKEEKK